LSAAPAGFTSSQGMKVMFDFDLADLYAVETKALNQSW
jgi:hypothetical protein